MEWKLILQLVGIALGLLYLWLEYRADIRLWVVGMIMPVVHGVLYGYSELYADCAMQLYYVLAGLYGWFIWHRHRRRKGKRSVAGRPTLQIEHTPMGVAALLVLVYAVVHGAIYCLLIFCTNSTVPFWDSFTTALSVVAMWMLSRKYAEQWLVWLVVDLTTVGLYLYKGIPYTAALYLLYSALAVAGYLRWIRKIGEQEG